MDAGPIREYISITQMLTEAPLEQVPSPVPAEEPIVSAPAIDQDLEEKLEHLVFKLRSYRDSDIGEYAAGIEAGMNRAADMLQNLMNRVRGL